MHTLKLKVTQPVINPENPFASDLLERESEIEILTDLIRNVNSPAVLSINSRWGTGKTTFIQLWKHHLANNNLPSLYFNSWTTDFSDDPLISFLGEMNEGLKDLSGKNNTTADAWEKTKQAGKKIAKKSIPAIIRIGTAGAVDLNELVESELSQISGSLADDVLTNYLNQKTAIQEFHDALKEYLNNTMGDNPLVIFVDELDRCRPNYAIELLERIKHLFNIEGLVFVLALDRDQLGHSIKSVYGDGIDSEGYLKRFIDFEYRIKLPSIDSFVEMTMESLELDKYLSQRKEIPQFENDGEKLLHTLTMLASKLNLSLREIEQQTSNLNIVVRSVNKSKFLYPELLVFLLFAKHHATDAYKRYVSGNHSFVELLNFLHHLFPENIRYKNYICARIEGYLLAPLNGNYNNRKTEQFAIHEENAMSESLDYDVIQYSQIVLGVAKDAMGAARGLDPQAIGNRLDWSERFNIADEKV